MPSTEAEWKSVAAGFEDKWNFSNCVGAMDGKHIAIQKPRGSGSLFFNYKHFFSVILFAVVNANYEFMYVHIGTNGCVSDATVFQNTKLYGKLINDELKLPSPSPLPGTNISLPYVFVGDSAFALNKHVMKPYPLKNISQDKRIFNYRLSRARRVVENTFGILASRFRLLHSTLSINTENVDIIVLACCVLHNYLSKKNAVYVTDTSVDNEDVTNLVFRPGEWRETHSLVPLCQTNVRQRNEAGNEVRNTFTTYFNNEGKLSFQEDMLRIIQ